METMSLVCCRESYSESSKEIEVDKLDKNEIKLVLASLNLKVLPKNVLEYITLRDLILDYNELYILPKNFCSKLNNLTYLSLNGNYLEELPNDICVLSNLKELHVNENNLEYLPESISKLANLEKLYLTGNLLKELPQHIDKLKSLKELCVDENLLVYLPAQFGHLHNLERMEASNNKIEVLPENFGSLIKLISLNMNRNMLKELPSSFAMLPSLTELDISENRIGRLPEVFHSAQCLHKLFVENNRITSIPVWFNDMKNICELSVKENCLYGSPFPERFGLTCTVLEYFDISGNNIEILPESFSEIKHLKFFDVGSPLYELERNRKMCNGNLLKRLPSQFGSLFNLCELHLDENYIEELPNNFGCLANLKFLDLNHNSLQILPESFGNLHSLKVCLLSLNYLRKLPSSFGNLFNLEELCLDNNQLSELPLSFCDLKKLKTLDLYKNCLTEIPHALKFVINLAYLDLGENDFGIAVEEVPEIIFKPTYVTNPEQKNNWRGRPQPGFTSPNESNKSLFLNEENIYNEDIHLSKEKLLLALKSSKFDRKHKEGNDEAQNLHSRRYVNKFIENRRMKKMENKEFSSFESGTLNEERSSIDTQRDDADNLFEMNTKNECWDDEFIDIGPYVAVEVDLDGAERRSDNSSLHGDNRTDSPLNMTRIPPDENWDDEIAEDNPYDNEAVLHHTLNLPKLNYGPFEQAFVPSDIHACPVQRISVEYIVEDGQFDDADL